MKKQVYLIIFVLAAIIFQSQTPVQPDPTKTKYVLLKTNRLLGKAHMAVKNYKVYTGNLGKAVQFERYAKKMYLEKNYKKAAQYSYRSREFTIKALEANKAIPGSDGTFSAEEKMIVSPMPELGSMEKELAEQNIALPTDEEMMPGNLDVTI